MRPWGWRLVAGVLLLVVLDVVFTVVDFAPDHLRLALVVGLGTAVAGLLWDTLGDGGPPWAAEQVGSTHTPGSDAHLATYVRLLESHLTAAHADSGLRDRLAALCDERLAQRHGLTRADPDAADLLGRAMLEDLAGPPRRLRRGEIDEYVRRIEEL